MTSVRSVLSQILDILNDAGAVLEEENGRVVLRMGSTTEQVPVNYLKRDDTVGKEHLRRNNNNKKSSTTNTTQQQSTVKNKNTTVIPSSSTTTTHQLRSNKTDNVKKATLVKTGKDDKAIKKELPIPSLKTRKKSSNNEQDIPPPATTTATTTTPEANKKKSTISTIENPQEAILNRRKSLRSSSSPSTSKKAVVENKLKAKVVAVEGSLSPAFVSSPPPRGEIEKPDVPKKRQRVQDDEDDINKNGDDTQQQQNDTSATTSKKRRLLARSSRIYSAVDDFCETSNEKLLQKIEHRGQSLFGGNNNQQQNEGEEKITTRSSSRTASVASHSKTNDTSTTSESSNEKKTLTIVYEDDDLQDATAKKGFEKKMKNLMLQQRTLVAKAGKRTSFQLIQQNTGMMNLHRYWVVWQSFSTSAKKDQEDTNNLHKVLFGKAKNEQDPEMEKTLKYLKAGERLSELAQKYGDFIVLIPEVFIPDELQHMNDQAYNAVRKRLIRNKTFQNTMDDLAQCANKNGSLYDVLWTKIGSE
ncbi:hypothetical protein BDA99DRAFT_505048 [Phascolomyces articulosus]|uniref:Uncharacterized protein n=1 Tax=Phascolomyces articulosus TaxID=60185 RepID=A0AAD5PFT3_9FUNG|nr:hypothetical protein BDA99DRAFT_505048 [Phascolomyces articulosus]